MRNLKKLLAVVVAICVLATFTIPAFAAETYTNESQASTLHDLGLYAGVSTSTFNPDLGTALDRETGVVLLMRVFGLDAKAQAMSDADVTAALAGYTDADKLASWAKKDVAYAIANKLVAGVTTTTIGPAESLTGQMYAALLLRELGFGDVAYADAFKTFADKSGFAGTKTDAVIKDDLVGMTFSVLKTADSTGKTVIDNLISAGVVDRAKAVAAGVVSGDVTATAAATGAKKLTVTFNQAIADTTKATFAVTRDGVAITTTATWAADKTSVDLAPATKLIAGNYAITVKGLTTADLSLAVNGVKDEAAAKIVLSSDKLAAVRDTDGNIKKGTITYKVYNQYNEDITTTAVAPTINWSSSLGGTVDVDGGTLTLNIPSGSTSYLMIGQMVVLTGVITDQSAAGVSVTGTLTVGSPASVDSVTFDKIYNVNGGSLATDSTFTDFKLLFTAKDQYGNDISKDQANNDLYVYSSNPSVVDIDQSFAGASKPVMDKQGPNTNELGIRFVKPGTPMDGTATIRLISKSTGKTFTFDVTSAKQSHVQKMSIQAPADAIASGETGITIPFTALDQNGASVTDLTELTNDVSLSPKGDGAGAAGTSGYLHFVKDYVNNVAVLKFEAPTVSIDTPIVLTAVTTTGSGSVTQLTITVKKVANPTTVSGVTSDVNPNLSVGATTTIKGQFVNILDQYGRSYDLKGHFGATITGAAYPTSADVGKYRLLISKSNSADANVTLTGTNSDTNAGAEDFAIYDKAGTSTVTITAGAIGTSAINVDLQIAVDNGASAAHRYTYNTVGGSTYTLSTTVNKKSNYSSYTIGDVSTIYDIAGIPTGLAAGNYTPSISVYGVVGSAKYLLNPNQYTINSDTTGVSATGNVVTANGLTNYATGESSVKANLIVTINADTNPVVLTKEITVSKDAPKAQSIAIDGDYAGAGAVHAIAARDNDNEISVTLNRTTPGATDVAFTTNDLKAILDNAMVVKDQYGQQLSVTYLAGKSKANPTILPDNMQFDTTGNRYTAGTHSGAGFQAGDLFSATYIVDLQYFSIKVLVK